MKARGYSWPPALAISAAPGAAFRDEEPMQTETDGGADELGYLLDEPPSSGSDQHGPGTVPSPVTTEQSLPDIATTATLTSKVVFSADVNLTKPSAGSASQARDSQPAATHTYQPRARSSRPNTATQPPSVSTPLPDPQKKLYDRSAAQGPLPVPFGSKPSLPQQQWPASPTAQPPPSAPSAQAEYFGQPSIIYANQPTTQMYGYPNSYNKPFPQPPAASPPDSLSSNATGLMSTRGPDALRNPTDKSDFEIVVEGIPAKLWDEEDEESLKGLLEEWVPPGQDALVSADGDQVLDIKRAGNSARCTIHTTLPSMFRFHFRFSFHLKTSNLVTKN